MGPGPANLIQNDHNSTVVMTSLTKTRNPKPNIFYQCRLKDLPSLWGFEQLSSTTAWWVVELLRHARHFTWKSPSRGFYLKITQQQRC